MTYRTKLMIFLSLLVVLSCGLTGAIMYTQAREILFKELQSKVLSIATSTAASINGDVHSKILSEADENSPEYRKLEKILRRVRDSNRRADVDVAYVYTILFDPDNPAKVSFGVDAEEDPTRKSHVGDPYEGKPGNPIRFFESQVDTAFSQDRWGTWLSANAPIKDSSGAVVAALGVDVRAKDVMTRLASIGWSLATAAGVALVLAIVLSSVLAGRVSRPLLTLKATVEKIGQGDLQARVPLKSKDEFGAVADAINSMAGGLQERDTLKNVFARYVSQQVLDGILDTGALPSLEGDRRKVTILFSDVRNFTTLSEGMSPEAVVGLLNEYFEVMIDIIFRNQGTLDKFIGDGLMVLFGAPLEDPLQEMHAVQAAVEMQQELERLSRKWKMERHIDFRVGIGIHTGQAVVGNIGSTRRMEYTAIGDTVNLASRLETATKQVGEPILISEDTYAAVRGYFETLDQGSIHVKGRHAPINVFSVGDSSQELLQAKVS